MTQDEGLRQLIAELRGALQSARRFIRNGIEFGYITMPEKGSGDSALRVPAEIDKALALAASPIETPAQSYPHRCSGCGLRWHTARPGSVAAELCGDCWRKVQPILHAALPSVREPLDESLVYPSIQDGSPTYERVPGDEVAEALGAEAAPLEVEELRAWKAEALVALARTDVLREALKGHSEYLGWNVCEAAAEEIRRLRAALAASPIETPADDGQPWPDGPAPCTNCGESAKPHPAYAGFVGPFCEGCWSRLLDHFGCECEVCEGTGTAEYESSGPAGTMSMECPKCNGSGSALPSVREPLDECMVCGREIAPEATVMWFYQREEPMFRRPVHEACWALRQGEAEKP